MSVVVDFPGSRQPGRLLSKKQLAHHYGKSPRWVNLRMAEGMPVEPRASENEPARFDLSKVQAWFDARAERKPMSLEERVQQLERTIALLVERKAS